MKLHACAHLAASKGAVPREEGQAGGDPGGMTPYLQAGDTGIYKSFKDLISPMIDAWKKASEVQYTKAGNPKPPAVEVVAGWVDRAWKVVPDSVVHKSVAVAGFSANYEDWHIARHDVYGQLFRQRWLAGADDSEVSDRDDVLDDFDELVIDDVVDL